MGIEIIAIAVAACLTVAGIILKWLYTLGQKLGRLNDCPQKIEDLKEDFNDFRERLTRIETILNGRTNRR